MRTEKPKADRTSLLCTSCKRRFKTNDALREHRNVYYTPDIEDELNDTIDEDSSDENRFSCLGCGKCSPTTAERDLHTAVNCPKRKDRCMLVSFQQYDVEANICLTNCLMAQMSLRTTSVLTCFSGVISDVYLN